MTKLTVSELVRVAHENAKEAGWWDKPVGDVTLNAKLCLVHSGISEAMEGYRKDLMDDKLPHRKMFEVELADVMIRVADTCGWMGVNLEHGTQLALIGDAIVVDRSIGDILFTTFYDAEYRTDPEYVPAILNQIHQAVSNCSSASSDNQLSNSFGVVSSLVINLAASMQLDLEGAILEKMAFNKTRADPEPENRAKVGGKKF